MALYHEDIIDIDLNSGTIARSFLSRSIGEGDDMANRYGVRLFRGNEAVSAESASVIGLFMAPNGVNYLISETTYEGSTGTSGNKAWVQLPEDCYAVEGQFSLAIKLSGGSVTGTMRIVDGVVTNTGSTGSVAPTSSIPSSAEIIAAYEEAVEVLDEAYISRGKISDLGYTSFSQCDETGFYTFSGADSIADLPAEWIGGGVLRVFVSGDVTWQEITGTVQCAVRYGTSGNWTMGFTQQGRISDHSFTSIGQCTKQGYYIFSGSDSLSDLPNGWTGGGLIVVYTFGTVTWQELIGTTKRFVRYGTSGSWMNENQNRYISAKYTGSAGDDDSTEQLDIFIPRTTSPIIGVRYNMGLCVDNDKNANVWRIIAAYRKEGSTERKATIRGEWECAVHLEGRSDFSGGIVHGDEVQTGIVVFVDGVLTSISSIDHVCKELKIVRQSNLYDPNDSTTLIAVHGVEYIYTAEGLTIHQSIEWKANVTLTNCYLAMLPVAKAYSNYRFTNVDFGVTENPSSNYSVTIPEATSVTEYNDTYDIYFEMSVPQYPAGMTGGDCALITDNGGGGYHKVYFPVCSEGTVNNGDIWKSTTVYRNK